MLGCFGVLNFSMVTIAGLYIAMGFFGYLRYGSVTEASITLNLPQSAPLAQMSLCMFSVAIFFSYALQFYVVMDIIGPNILRPRVSEAMYPYAEQLTRVVLNVFTRELFSSIHEIILTCHSRDGCHGALAGPAGVSAGGGQDEHLVSHGSSSHRLRGSLDLGHRGCVRVQVRQEHPGLHYRVPGLHRGDIHQHPGDRQQLQKGWLLECIKY